MSRMVVRMFAGAVVAALAGVAVAMTAGPASADDSSVSFSGNSPLGLPLLSCASAPSRSSISMTTDDSLDVQNLTGHSADIYLNGKKTSSQVGSNQSVPITFPAGSWTLGVVPSCVLNLGDASTTTVTVSKPAAVVVPSLVQTQPPAGGSDRNGGASMPAVSVSDSGATKVPKHAPTVQAKSTPTVKSTAAATPTAVATGTAGASAGKSKGAAAPGTDDPSTGSDTTNAAGAADQVSIGTAQALPASEITPTSPDYLLVVIAFIGILGVGSAAVRALMNQRRRAAH